MGCFIWLRTTPYEQLFEGRIIAVNLPKKWIRNFYNSGEPNAAGEELDKNNRTGEFQNVSLRYFAVMETIPFNLFLTDELEFCIRIAQDIDAWLSSRPLPEGHTRFFHGTFMEQALDR
jgi:hypothetical protein